MKTHHLILTLLSLPLLAGCNLMSAGVDSSPRIYTSGIIDSHIAITGFGQPTSQFMDIDLFEGGIISADLWPLGGFEIGIAGARVQILPFSFGVGTLFYDADQPRKRRYTDAKPYKATTVVVAQVIPGTQAETLGLKTGDILRTYAGTHIKSIGSLHQLIGQQDDDDIELVVHRPLGEDAYSIIKLKVKRGKIGVMIQQTNKGDYEIREKGDG